MVDHPLHDKDNPATSWALNPWHPMTRPIDIKHLGKLAEEIGESVEVLAEAMKVMGRAQAAISRCLIQGIDEAEPITGVVNREWLENELADTKANIMLVCERFHLDVVRMDARVKQKLTHLRGWHSMLET